MIVTITNQKGGTGKTTSAISIGSALNRLGKSVLLIDLDSQRDLTKCLGVIKSNTDNNINSVLLKSINIKDAIIKLESGLSVIRGSEKLADTQARLTDQTVLRDALKSIRNKYDYIIIDTQPSLSFLTIAAFLTSHQIWISFQPEWIGLTGIKDLKDTIEGLKQAFKIDPIIKVFVTMYDARKRLHGEAVELMRKHFDNVFNTYIRTNVALAEAPAGYQDIFTYDPKSHGAIDYLTLAKETIDEQN